MKKLLLPALLVTALTFTYPASAATAVLSGTVTQVAALGNNANYTKGVGGIVIFQLSNLPAVTGCPGGTQFFSFSEASVTDTNSLQNLLSMLMTAKTAGLTVSLAYDNAGAYCDAGPGYAVPYEITIQ